MTSRPSTSMAPEVGSISRLIIFMVVVLPQPDGPTSTTVSPSSTSSERSVTAAPLPSSTPFVTSVSEILTFDTAPPPGWSQAVQTWPTLIEIVLFPRASQEAPDPFPGQRGSLGLKASNGLRQERQKWVDRHNVGPN